MSPHGVYRSTTGFTRERFPSVDLRKATKLVLHCFVSGVESNFRSGLSVPLLACIFKDKSSSPSLGLGYGNTTGELYREKYVRQ